MRRLSMIIMLLTLALAPAAWAQENNPCQLPNTQVTDPRVFYVLSDQLSTPAVTSVTLIITQGDGNEPVERITVAAASLQATGFFGCVKGSYMPAAHLLRDGQTVYYAMVRLEHSAGFVSPWSGKTPFVLSAPVVEPLRAPTLRLGRTEE
jgi:hypothetical protein